MKMNNIFKKIINKETILYIIFGILTTAVDYVTYCILRFFDVNYLIANLLSWTLAVAFAYVTNKLLVFNSHNKDKSTLLQESISFLCSRILSLAFSMIFIWITVSLFGVYDLVAKILSSVIVVIMNYVLSKLYVFKDNSEEKGIRFLSSNILYIVSFIIPVLLLAILYFVREIYPFGDQMYLRSDCYHQYAPFHKELWRKILSGESLNYSWNVGLGVNFTALFAYYLASPLNWIIGLVSESHITEIMSAFIVVKIGFCSMFFSYYLSKKFDTKKMSIAAFSIFYALSSYICAFSWNLMWLDCILLFPLVILGIERLVKEGKCSLYCISLGLCILSNYYIAIMICIFSVLYFVFEMLTNGVRTFKNYINKIVSFGIHSLLAGGFASVLFIPAFCALSQTASGELEFPENLERYFSVLKMLSRSLMNVSAAVFEPHDPNLYCTVAVFILLPIYWFSTKIKTNEKIGKTILLGTLLLSFNLNIPNFIWHGFHFPNSLPCRESFIFIFLILVMCYEGFMHIREASNKQLFGAYGCSVALILFFEEIFVDEEYTFKSIYLSIMFLTFYLFVFMMFRSKSTGRYFLSVYVLLLVSFSETFINTEATGFSTTSRTEYLQDNNNIQTLIDQVNEDNTDFFRMEKYQRRTKNDAAWHGYRGASIFSSTTNAALSEIYGTLGLEESFNAYAYYGHTPLTEALLSIRYVFGNELLDDDNLRTLYASVSEAEETTYLYENSYVLPLGFMVDTDFADRVNTSTTNPFAVQNSLSNALGGNGEMFTRLDVDSFDINNEVTAEEDMHMYVYCTSSLETLCVDITDKDGTLTTQTFDSMTHKHIVDIGYVAKDSVVNVTDGDSEESIQIYAYSFNEEVFTSLIDSLNKNPMTVLSFSDGYVKGEVTADKDGMLFTSIPNDKGWTVFVDGEEIKAEAFEDALIMIPITAGTHSIEFKFTPDGIYLGMTLSILSILAFIVIMVCKRKLNNIKTDNVKNPVQE